MMDLLTGVVIDYMAAQVLLPLLQCPCLCPRLAWYVMSCRHPCLAPLREIEIRTCSSILSAAKVPTRLSSVTSNRYHDTGTAFRWCVPTVFCCVALWMVAFHRWRPVPTSYKCLRPWVDSSARSISTTEPCPT